VEAFLFLSKALENLSAAQLCQQNSLYNACANRAYFAMFQAAVAILLSKGFSFDPKKHFDHAQIQSLFANELIHRRKILQNKFKSYLQEAEAVRGKADYSIAAISQNKAKRQLGKAEEFIEVLRKEISHV